MRATAKFLIVGIMIAIGLASSFAHAVVNPASATLLVGGALGQPGASDPAAKRQESERLLKQARKAMDAGQLDEAERLINSAARLNVQYDPLVLRFVDTPDKARNELAIRRGNGRSTRPSQQFAPLPEQRTPRARQPSGSSVSPEEALQILTQGASAPARGPDLPATPSEAAAMDARQLPPLPNYQPRRAEQSPLHGTVQSNPYAAAGGPAVADPAKLQAQRLLWEARRALSRGDVAQAKGKLNRAHQANVVFAAHEDSPTKVGALIERFNRYTQGPARGDVASQTRDYARFLMDQAEGFLAHHDMENSRQLAEQAQAMRVPYGPQETTPQQLLRRIAAVQQAGGQAAGGGPRQPADPRGPVAEHPRKAEAKRLVALAEAALSRGDVRQAERLSQQANALRVPNDAFGASETAPWQLSLKINSAINRRGYAVKQAGFEALPAVASEAVNEGGYPVRRGLYNPDTDTTSNQPAQALQPAPGNPPNLSPNGLAGSQGDQLFRRGLSALQNQQREQALEHFRAAWKFKDQLDPVTLQQLRDKLVLLSAANNPGPANNSPLEQVSSQQQLLRQKLAREISGELAAAEKERVSDPKGSLNRLQRVRGRITDSELEATSQKQLLTLLDRGIQNAQTYIEQNRANIELQERNDGILGEIARERQQKEQVQNKIAQLVDEFNTLVDERRYAEAELLAKQVRELDPDLPVAQIVLWKSRFIRRIREQESINEEKEQGVVDALTSVVGSSAPFDDRRPYRFGDRLDWNDLTNRRSRFLEQHQRRLLPEEVEIQKNLLKKVDVRFDNAPLAEVLQVMGDLAGVPVHLDQAGMAAEAVTSGTPISINLSQPVSLRSALNLILAPLRLSYVIENEVLNVTSESARDTHTYTEVYNVADLVIPIPNFIPGYNVGLPAAIREAHNAIGYGGMGAVGMQNLPMQIAANEGMGAANSSASVLSQLSSSGMLGTQGARPSQPSSMGPGGMGGAALADFDTLIDLITTTIAPQTWDDVGGPGAIESFPTNLSLVVSQTQDVHEQIADLLDQLRRLQDLQITIEVRFITLNDEFFERIGIDFDFDIDDNTRLSNSNPRFPDDVGPSMTFGLDPTGAPTADLDLQFNQGSFGAAVPQFGNFDAMTAANFGFAILSDIEVFFLLQAATGNERSNVLQAPKVTLFNGQSATVSDTSQRPFVTSIIPVVGDFAAAHQPVIVVLNEGTSLNVQAVVSNDRRFVRLTLVPFFSEIGEVDTFTFNGSTSSDSGSVVDGVDGNPTDAVDNVRTTTSGSTVQLPTFSFTTVSTTVSVPDGGTVLLGGIKRLAEGRNERGVPMLSKLPYVSRLFKNVGIGRTTQTLMMMVTPRIIIQEEEEAKLGIDLDL